jgi:signal transduction histidine kinase/DNA-binding response OmpR family regulator/ligand-binding sensor domain-containing protein
MLAAALLLLAAPGTLPAGDSDYAFDPLDENQVLSQSSIHAFAQDRRGFLWIGTQYGLDRYDGFEIQRFNHDPNDPETLSDDFVLDLLVDRDGMLWVGSRRGLDRLDPATGRVTRHAVAQIEADHAVFLDAGTLVELPNGTVMASASGRPFRVDGPGRLAPVEVRQPVLPQSGSFASLALDHGGTPWLANHFGIWRYDPGARRFEPIEHHAPSSEHRHFGPHMISPGPGRTMAHAGVDHLLLIDIDRGHRIRRLRPTDHGAGNDHIQAVAIDSSNHLWLTMAEELVRVPPDLAGPWQRFPAVSLDRPDDPSQFATLFIEDSANGQIWLSGRFGLKRFDPASGDMLSFEHDPSNPRSLPATLGEIGYRIFMDRFGVLWVGGNLGGIVRRPPQRDRFVHVRDSTPTPISRNIVRAVAEQNVAGKEFVWVANQGHGVVVWRRSGDRSYTIEHHYPAGDHDRRIDRVRHMAIDPVDGRVWAVGGGGLLYATRPGAPLRQVELPIDANHLAGGRRIEFLGPDRMVLGTSQMLFVLELDSTRQPSLVQSVPLAEADQSFELFSLAAAGPNSLFAAGHGGLQRIDLESGRTHRFLPGGDLLDTPANQLFSVAVDREGAVWIGTRGGGLARMQPAGPNEASFEFFDKTDGLPDDTVYAILPDEGGELWLSTNRGMVRFRPEAGSVRHYTPGDGVQAWEFSNAVAHIGASGRYYFGGVNGWNTFRPGTVRDLLQAPLVQLKSVRVDGDAVPTIAPGGRLELDHDRNQLSIDYVGLHFAAPGQVRYQYRLQGLQEQWIDAGTARQAQWASLPAGAYEFQLRAANPDGIWSLPASLLSVRVHPAPWNTRWARLAYLIAILVLILFLLRYQHEKRRRLQQLVARRTHELAEQKDVIASQAAQLRDALEARTLMFANVSHEFRTPLTLIRASIDKLERAPDPAAAAQGRRYIARLLRLVEQLLDLSRLRLTEVGGSETAWRLDSLVSQTVDAFRPVAEHRSHRLSCATSGAWHTECPREAVERILINLIANAIKFTPNGGTITVGLAPDPAGVVLEVADSGPGIPEDQHELIFHRFYRTGATQGGQNGAGIGLALVHEAVRAIGGRIEVDSAPGEGARFRIRMTAERPRRDMPLRPVDLDMERQQLDLDALIESPIRAGEPTPVPARSAAARRQPRVLVVEDNEDLRELLTETLGRRWRVASAENGEQGYQNASRLLPDLIVTDLMMPDVDGFEMLQRLRGNIATSHIPVLFLTARQDQETRLRAYALSADAFLSKPFDERELETRIEQMLLQRQRLQSFLRRSGLDRPIGRARESGGLTPGVAAMPEATEAVSARDRQLLGRLDAWLDLHYSDPGADVEGMAAAVHMSPRTLQRKLKSLTGQTPAARLRDVRLERARDRLAAEDRSVTEIGLECGFASAQYFSRVFRRQFGVAPDQWRRSARLG